MKIYGKRYLDANSYEQISILENNTVNVSESFANYYPLKKGNISFADELEAMPPKESRKELIGYFLKNNNVNFVSIYDESKKGHVASDDKQIFIDQLNDEEREMIMKKYLFDRAKEMFNNDFDECYISTSNSSYYNKRKVKDKRKYVLNLRSFNGVLDYVEMCFIKTFFEDKLSSKQDMAIICGTYDYDKQCYTYELICDDIKVLFNDQALYELLCDIIINHNIEVEDNEVKQLKLKGF